MSLLNEHLKTFLCATPKQKGYFPTTIKQYRIYLEDLCRWLGPTATLDQFTEENLCRYCNRQLEEHDWRPRTINHHISALKAFGAWLRGQRLIKENPAEVLEKVKLDEPVRYEISSEDAFALIEGCERLYKPMRRALCKAVMCILIHGGLRHSEVINLTVEDFSVNERLLHVRKGKGGKSRAIPLIDLAVAAIEAWIALRPPDCRPEATRRNSLFMLNRLQPMGSKGLNSVIAEVCAANNYKKHVTPHSFRHCFATRLLRNSNDVVAVAKLLGHSQPSTTLNVYVHTDAERVRAVAEMSGYIAATPQMPSPVPSPGPEVSPMPAPAAEVPTARSRRVDRHSKAWKRMQR